MSAYYYDEALVKKFQGWTTNTNVHIYGPDDTKRLFEVIADTSGDKPIELPIVCLRRRGGYQIINTNKKPMTFDGFTKDATVERSIQVNAIPISIPYQIDVYARHFKEADAYLRNLIFNIINFPTLSIVIPYNDANIEHYGNIRIASEVEDNSDIPERIISGQFTRMSLFIDLDDAYLWDARVRTNWSIGIDEVEYEK